MFLKDQVYILQIDYKGLILEGPERGLYLGVNSETLAKYKSYNENYRLIEYDLRDREANTEENMDEILENCELVTQCEANHARKIFPCIDEPAFKSIF